MTASLRSRECVAFGAGILLVAEALAFGCSYLCWYRMNTSRDFRLFMHKNFPWALEGYYSVGSILGGESSKEKDILIWSREGKVDDN
ncbi:protein CEBPZOS-like isoform X2 [Ischnura elegans]|uniref:protein CEBPZOS-like isoform X2 n=1 Tax=Ischnura elegans TaxID=197161 RepID=UPI001ED8A783|nr:protein CEBPZOS-like isoform X2 [Ischnura elegans]